MVANPSSLRRLSCCIALVAGLGACGDASFTARYAPDLRRDGVKLSVFGVYKDGRMSAEEWRDFAARFAPAFGSGTCEAAYGEALLTSDAGLAAAIDEQTRADGVSDELLQTLAPAADGDTIAVLTVMGLPSQPHAGPTQPPAVSIDPGTRGGRRGGRGGPGLTASRPHEADGKRDALEVALSLYSVREQRSVGFLAMTYQGKDADAAMAAFVERVRTEMPNARCAGWKRDVKIAPETVGAVRPKE